MDSLFAVPSMDEVYIKQMVVVMAGYLLGSIPFGLILTRLAGHGDIRNIGSGNIGATNVMRTGNWALAVLTLLLDGLKGYAAVMLAEYYYPQQAAVAGLAALLGHMFPIWLQGKGGKGVATAIGVITALSWRIGVCSMSVWLLIAVLFRYSSFAALIAIFFMPLNAFLFKRPDIAWLSLIIIILVYTKHSENIERLLKGTEKKIGHKDDTPPS